jgi:pre-60S factor REI1
MEPTTPSEGCLTSTTAPGKIFACRAEIAQHYKSDWHKYNLKRREAGLALLKEADFQLRLETALALRKEREGREERTGKDHLKNGKESKKKKEKGGQGTKLGGATAVSQAGAYDRMKVAPGEGTEETKEAMDDDDAAVDVPEGQEMEEEEEAPDINPYQCLFDKHISSNIDANVERMHRKYGFFIPDQEYLIDKEGLVGYCHEKIKLGHVCIFCQKTFTTWQGCQKHMISTRHTKLKYERGIDMEEFDPFFDFAEADAEFLARYNQQESKDDTEMDVPEEKGNGDDVDGEWEDVSDDEEMEDKVEEESLYDGVYDGYQEEIAKYGFDVTPLGELILPDGRIIGHRSLSIYYKQHFRTEQEDPAVAAARKAAGERLYKGRVYQTGTDDVKHENSLVLLRAGITPGTAQGRSGKGILVAGAGGYSAVSLYRYKAVVAKTKRDELRGRIAREKVWLPMNKMDKRANNKMNGVSVAHALR